MKLYINLYSLRYIDDRAPKTDFSEDDDKEQQEEDPPIQSNDPSQRAVPMPQSVTETEETSPSATFACKQPKNTL